MIIDPIQIQLQRLQDKVQQIDDWINGGGTIGPKGEVGPRGEVGPQGKQGIPGPQGLQGEQGIPGPQGLQGETGLQGVAGAIGATGPQGPQGETGQPGRDGAGVIDENISLETTWSSSKISSEIFNANYESEKRPIIKSFVLCNQNNEMVPASQFSNEELSTYRTETYFVQVTYKNPIPPNRKAGVVNGSLMSIGNNKLSIRVQDVNNFGFKFCLVDTTSGAKVNNSEIVSPAYANYIGFTHTSAQLTEDGQALINLKDFVDYINVNGLENELQRVLEEKENLENE